MNARLCTAGFFVLTLALAGSLGFGADDKPKAAAHESMSSCCKSCADCMQVCESCARHCAELLSQGKRQHLHTMAMCVDCGDICSLSARLTARQGPLSPTVCEACAKACEECAAACATHPDDEQMKACAESCRECAKACRAMIKDVGKAGAKRAHE